MNLNTELQQLNNRLDKLQRKLDGAINRNDQIIIEEARKEIDAQKKRINSVKSKKQKEVFKQTEDIKKFKFSRVITKQEQADLGKLKKKVKKLLVVHPLTALGKELNLKEVTGFAHQEF